MHPLDEKMGEPNGSSLMMLRHLCNLVEHHPCRHTHIERLLLTVHGDLCDRVTRLQHLVGKTMHLFTKDECGRSIEHESVITNRPPALLHRKHPHTIRLESRNELEQIVCMFPGYHIFSAERRFCDVVALATETVDRKRGASAQVDLTRPRSVRGAQDGTHIVSAANIIEYDK